MEEPKGSRSGIITSLMVVGLIVVIIVGVMAFTGKEEEPTANTAPSPSTDPSNSAAATSEYQDGTYKSGGSYVSPGGTESISVTLTVKEGVVTSAEAEEGATNSTAEEYQSEFIAGFEQQVVGRKLGEINVSRVSGSSLTPKGFNDALQRIKAQAKA